MKVYVVMESDFDYGVPRGIFSSQEKAAECVTACKGKDRIPGYEICEFELDEVSV